jgi:glutamate formiminotransferase/formiminotetrahydrofolate cyclodeaminase
MPSLGKPLIECVPNFSEGRDMAVIRQITDAVEQVEGVKLLDVDPGKATNRTVVTFVGEPSVVIEAAFRAIAKAAEVIDMSKHSGEHPRMGATDVCPLIPIANISMEETAAFAHELGERVAQELGIPIYMYESAASRPERRNLATIRAGEYEGLATKLAKPEWSPDYGEAVFNPKSGATVIGARDFLVAYNVNLNTTSVKRANSVAFDVREKGRILREGDSVTGDMLRDEHGAPRRSAGACKAVKAIGWYIAEYGIAQISMNLTNINITPLHIAFEECRKSADRRGLRVTGSELVGLVPLKVLTDTGRYFLKKQRRSLGVSESELIHIAVKSLGLDELAPFDPQKKIIEYQLAEATPSPLAAMDLRRFADEAASESPAPGGGSVAAYVGALGAALAAMVANLSAGKRGWEDRWESFSDGAEQGQAIKYELLRLVDEDTRAFNAIMEAFRLPKGSEAEILARKQAIQAATLYAAEVPLQVMRTASSAWQLVLEMVEKGNPNSASDGGVGALCLRTAIMGAGLNVKINVAGLDDKALAKHLSEEAERLMQEAVAWEGRVLKLLKM